MPTTVPLRRSIALAALACAPGCLIYDAPINQRPSIAIRATSDELVYRGDEVRLMADLEDPDIHFVKPQWRAYACTEVPDACDTVPFEDGILEQFAFIVPTRRLDADVPVRALRVVLEAEDELGAVARPSQELVIPVDNHAPTVELDRSSRYRFVVGTPIGVFARLGDRDDGPLAVDLVGAPEVFAPAQLAHTLVDRAVEQDPADPAHRLLGWTLTPQGPGDWMIRVTARDPLGATGEALATISVMPDTPPCLAQLQPAVPPAGLALPLTEPVLFRAPVVIDDLDVFPPVAGDPVLGTTRFQWSLQGPGGGGHVVLPDATGNSVALDPATYRPGDTLELRVEVFDRRDTAIPCPGDEPTCSVISEPTCLQRQTWRVEVR